MTKALDQAIDRAREYERGLADGRAEVVRAKREAYAQGYADGERAVTGKTRAQLRHILTLVEQAIAVLEEK